MPAKMLLANFGGFCEKSAALMATPGPYMRGVLRNLLGFGSMLAGGALVHNYYAPDLVSAAA